MTHKEAEIELNLFYIALRGHPIGTAVAVVPTFDRPGDTHLAPGHTDRDALRSHLQPSEKTELGLEAKVVPVAVNALEYGTVRPNPHPADQIWQLSHSTVTCSEAE